MKKIYKNFKQLTLNFGVGNFQASRIYNILGLNNKFFPLKLKNSHVKSLEALIKVMPTTKNLKNSIKQAIDFDQNIKTFKSLKTRSKFLKKNHLKSIDVKKKSKI